MPKQRSVYAFALSGEACWKAIHCVNGTKELQIPVSGGKVITPLLCIILRNHLHSRSAHEQPNHAISASLQLVIWTGGLVVQEGLLSCPPIRTRVHHQSKPPLKTNLNHRLPATPAGQSMTSVAGSADKRNLRSCARNPHGDVAVILIRGAG